MSDRSNQFHEFALHTGLFKGRSDWYFCYLKGEKLTHALVFLARHGAAAEDFTGIINRAGALPGAIAHLCAGEVDLSIILGDVFGLLSDLRLLGARELLSEEQTALLCSEYELLAERLVRGANPSPFASSSLQVVLPNTPPPLLESPTSLRTLKDTSHAVKDSKGHSSGSKGQSDRMSLILELVRKKKSLSIKDIAAVIRGCSEKTIQRELNILIEQGLVRREGERRWSVYRPA